MHIKHYRLSTDAASSCYLVDCDLTRDNRSNLVLSSRIVLFAEGHDVRALHMKRSFVCSAAKEACYDCSMQETSPVGWECRAPQNQEQDRREELDWPCQQAGQA